MTIGGGGEEAVEGRNSLSSECPDPNVRHLSLAPGFVVNLIWPQRADRSECRDCRFGLRIALFHVGRADGEGADEGGRVL